MLGAGKCMEDFTMYVEKLRKKSMMERNPYYPLVRNFYLWFQK